jgi:hypothetical protein
MKLCFNKVLYNHSTVCFLLRPASHLPSRAARHRHPRHPRTTPRPAEERSPAARQTHPPPPRRRGTLRRAPDLSGPTGRQKLSARSHPVCEGAPPHTRAPPSPAIRPRGPCRHPYCSIRPRSCRSCRRARRCPRESGGPDIARGTATGRWITCSVSWTPPAGLQHPRRIPRVPKVEPPVYQGFCGVEIKRHVGTGCVVCL